MLVLALSTLFFAATALAQGSSSDPNVQCLETCFDQTIGGDPSASECADVTTAQGIEYCVCTNVDFSNAVAKCLVATCPANAQNIATSVINFCQSSLPPAPASTGNAGSGSSGIGGGVPTSGGGVGGGVPTSSGGIGQPAPSTNPGGAVPTGSGGNGGSGSQSGGSSGGSNPFGGSGSGGATSLSPASAGVVALAAAFAFTLAL